MQEKNRIAAEASVKILDEISQNLRTANKMRAQLQGSNKEMVQAFVALLKDDAFFEKLQWGIDNLDENMDPISKFMIACMNMQAQSPSLQRLYKTSSSPTRTY